MKIPPRLLLLHLLLLLLFLLLLLAVIFLLLCSSSSCYASSSAIPFHFSSAPSPPCRPIPSHPRLLLVLPLRPPLTSFLLLLILLLPLLVSEQCPQRISETLVWEMMGAAGSVTISGAVSRASRPNKATCYDSWWCVPSKPAKQGDLLR